MTTAQVRPVVGFDTETHLVRPDGDGTRRMVCATFYGGPETLATAKLVADAAGADGLIFEQDGEWGLILHRDAGPALLAVALEAFIDDEGAIVCAHNLAFDAKVLVDFGAFTQRQVFGFTDCGALTCTKIREQLLAIASDDLDFDTRLGRKHGFALVDCVEAYFGEFVAQEVSQDKAKAAWNWDTLAFDLSGNTNSWRMRYAELEAVPLSEWPSRAVMYAIEDAQWSRAVYMKQAKPRFTTVGDLVRPDGVVVDEARQVRASVDLDLVGTVGVLVESEAVEAFAEEVTEAAGAVDRVARSMGFLTVNKCKDCYGTGWTGDPPTIDLCMTCFGDPGFLPPRARVPLESPTKNTKRLQAWVAHAFGYQPPMTAPSEKFPYGQVKTDEDTLNLADNPGLKEYAEGLGAKKLLSTYVPILRRGAEGRRIRPSFNTLVKSGRTSCRDPNYQNPPRADGFRDCHVAPEGHVFCSLDYSTLELRTFAQTCLNLFGYSKMAEAFALGFDPHLSFGLDLLEASTGQRIPYELGLAALDDKTHELHKTVAFQRQLAKIANFGLPGGLGASAFVDYCRGYGVAITIEDAQFLKDRWLEMWPEAKDFFAYIAKKAEHGNFEIAQPWSGRIRGGCTYTSGANTLFQGPAADGMKLALARLHDEMYGEPDSPLYGVRVWNVIHDEALLEGPAETAHEWAYRAAQVMVEAMQQVTPDIQQIVEPALMRRWKKKAWTYHDEAGTLRPFEDDPKYKKAA